MTRAELEQKTDTFFAKWDNQPLNFDGLYGNQCKDVFSAFNSEVLGHSYIYGNAVNVWNNAHDEWFEKIENTPTGVPIKGDIPIWNAKVGGGFGHIDIAKGWGNTNQFDGFDQNWPTEGYYDKDHNFIGTGKCHTQRHNYTNLIGWLRPRTQEPAPVPIHVPIPVPEPVPVIPTPPAPAPEPIPTPPPIEPAPSALPDPTPPVIPPATPSAPPVEVSPSTISNIEKGLYMTWINGKKTYIVLIVAIISAIVAAWNGTISWIDAYGLILAALTTGGFRSALSKVK